MDAVVTACPCCGCRQPVPDHEPDWDSGEITPLHDLLFVPESRHGRWWLDHIYRFRDGSGRWVYVSEPYEVHIDVLQDLAALMEAGWDVMISASPSLHFPGSTVRVAIWRSHGA